MGHCWFRFQTFTVWRVGAQHNVALFTGTNRRLATALAAGIHPESPLLASLRSSMMKSAGAAWRTVAPADTGAVIRASLRGHQRHMGGPVVLVCHVASARPQTSGNTAVHPLQARADDNVALGVALTTRAFSTTAGDLSTPQSVPMTERLPLRLGSGHVSSLQTSLVVDKTDLLARILTNDGPAGTEPFLVATAPRRFGKSFAVMQLAAMARGEKHSFDGYHVRAAGAGC